MFRELLLVFALIWYKKQKVKPTDKKIKKNSRSNLKTQDLEGKH